MSEVVHERRGLLLSTAAWLTGLAAVAATRSAHAFQVEEMPPASAIGRAYAGRCGGSFEHAALIARLQALLATIPLPGRCRRLARFAAAQSLSAGSGTAARSGRQARIVLLTIISVTKDDVG
jgi:hypothetical protein